jgi:ferric-dicitrate binding protein FerR (iron transport regulator)
MKDQINKDLLVKRYIENKATEEELAVFFHLLEKGELDEQLSEQVLLKERVANHPKQVSVKTGTRTMYGRISVAASLILIVALGYLFRTELTDLVSPTETLTQHTSPGERKHILLIDGTEVWLSPESTLSYPDKFRGDNRMVTLSGEAFFDVKSDTEHPFIILSDNVVTKVLGTAFNITAFQDEENITVTLLEGSVALEVGDSGKTIPLTPNQKGVYSKTEQTLQTLPDPEAQKFLDRRNGIFHYEGALLSEISHDLIRQYGVQIFIDKQVADVRFRGRLDSNQEIETFLDKLAMVTSTKWEQSGNQYIIKPN